MNVSRPMPLEEFARRKVAAREFESVEDVLCEGLRLLQLREKWKSEAGVKIDAGWEQANSGRLLSPEQARENLASRKERAVASQRPMKSCRLTLAAEDDLFEIWMYIE